MLIESKFEGIEGVIVTKVAERRYKIRIQKLKVQEVLPIAKKLLWDHFERFTLISRQYANGAVELIILFRG